MSDLRTELFTKVIPKMNTLTKPTELNNLNFDDPEQPLEVAPEILSNNELIFNYVKEHPACYGADVAKHFNGRISTSSVLSQIHTMARRELFHKVKCSTTGYLMYSTAVDAYPRAKGTERTARLLAAISKMSPEERGARIKEGHRKAKLKQAEQQLAPTKKIVLVKKEEQVAPRPAGINIDLLPLSEARRLYDELRKVFGG
jgi:hypothetical protein